MPKLPKPINHPSEAKADFYDPFDGTNPWPSSNTRFHWLKSSNQIYEESRAAQREKDLDPMPVTINSNYQLEQRITLAFPGVTVIRITPGKSRLQCKECSKTVIFGEALSGMATGEQIFETVREAVLDHTMQCEGERVKKREMVNLNRAKMAVAVKAGEPATAKTRKLYLED